jgi:Mn2+/Fe2+ NRAMP family transporter
MQQMTEQHLTTTTAQLDAAHVGDIEGAWGTLSQAAQPPRRGWLKRLNTLLIIMGPGLVTMIGDNDAGGIATYTQAGQNYGTSLLWTLLILIPVLIVNQEMVARLGAVTRVGHARLIFERFGTFWGAFSFFDLLLVNELTLVTEFIGFAMALNYFGVSPLISIPVGILGLVVIVMTGSFRRWERVMWINCLVSLLMIPIAFLPHPAWGPIVHDTFLPGVAGGLNGNALLTIIAIVGTTVAPWQLFFQQSNVVDKRITSRWLRYERLDTILGSILTNLEAAGLIIAAAFAFAGTRYVDNFIDAGTTARAYAALGHPLMGTLLMIILLNASMLGACAVTLSTAYAVGDVFSVTHSLHRRFHEAKLFYSVYLLLIVLAGGLVLIPNAPLGLLTFAVQALAGILLPSATVFLVLLCNDRAVLGPWINRFWLNAVAAVIVGLLVALSFILAMTTLFPDMDAMPLTRVVFAILLAALVMLSVLAVVRRLRRGPDPELTTLMRMKKEDWQMPPLKEIPRPTWSLTRRVGMVTLRAYLLAAMVLLVVKVVELALGH